LTDVERALLISHRPERFREASGGEVCVRITGVVPVQPEWKDGHLLSPARPGLGIEFDREAAKKRYFRMTEPPHLRRPDGSVTNW
jgi:hypothetical protein